MAKRPVNDEDDFLLLRDDLVQTVQRDLAKAKSPVTILLGKEALAAQRKVDLWVPTGIYQFDWILSKGRGLPTGRSVELYGAEAVGKTALCEYLSGIFRRLGSPIHYLDFEQSLDEGHLGCYGVSLDDLILPDCPSMEDGWDYIDRVLARLAGRKQEQEEALKRVNARAAKGGDEKLLKRDEKLSRRKDPPALFIYDSIAQATPKAELEESIHEDAHVAVHARAAAKGFRKHTRRINNSSALFLFVNQVRSVVGATKFQAQTTTPGGRAPKYAFSLRLQLHKAGSLSRKGQTVGQLIGVTTKKNKHAPYPQECQIVLSYRCGIDVAQSNFLFFRENGVITTAGTKGYKWRGVKEPFAKPDFRDWAVANPEKVAEEVQTIYDNLRAELSAENEATTE